MSENDPIATEAVKADLATARQRLEAGDLTAAEALVRAELGRASKDAAALDLLGAIQARAGRHKDAVESLRRAVAVDASVAARYAGLADSLAALGKVGEAVAAYGKSLQLDSRCAAVHYSLGRALTRQGRVDDAMRAYALAIGLDPNLPDARLHLGQAHLSRGRYDAAAAELHEALRLQPDSAEAAYSLGRVLQLQHKPEESIALYRRAAELDPRHVAAHTALAVLLKSQNKVDEAWPVLVRAAELQASSLAAQTEIGSQLVTLGRLEEAADCFRRAVAARPDDAHSYSNLASCLHLQCREDEAIPLYHRALAMKPGEPSFHNNLGTSLHFEKRYDEAAASYRRAIALKPDYVQAHLNFANTLDAAGRSDEALTEYRRAVELDPHHAEAWYNLGLTLQKQYHHREAVPAFQRAVALKPSAAAYHANLATSLLALSLYEQAIASYRRAVELEPHNASFHNNLGNILNTLGKYDEAIACYQRAIALKPDYADAFNNLGSSEKSLGRHEDAIASYRKAIELVPDFAAAQSNLLFGLHFVPGVSRQKLFEEHKLWGESHRAAAVSHRTVRDPDRVLRVGYVSADFKTHSVAYFVESIFAAHGEGVEIVAYSDVARPDDMTQRLRAHATRWRHVVGLSSERVAQMVREDGIDILVDLAGHTAGNRLGVFALKPAPVQVTYLGYPNTTGLPAMDYRITDSFADPPGLSERLHTEQLVRIDPCAWCFSPPASSPPVRKTWPDAARFTFGCFNASPKINAPLVALWSRILQNCPGSRLLLKNKSLGETLAREALLRLFAAQGVGADRLSLIPWAPRPREHLEAYHQVDLALDTFPYHGTTTTCEALWMGVPVVCLAGDAHVSRVGVSLLNNVGLGEWVARSPDEYVALATTLARDVQRLGALREGLRQRVQASPLMDAKGFTRGLEAAYRRMWKAWCSALAPG